MVRCLSWSPMSAKRPFLKSKLWFGSERFFVGLETTSKLGYSQMDGMENLRTSVAVHQYTYQHVGPWTQHAGPSLDYLGDFSPRGLSVQYTQDFHGCPPAHTGRPWLSVAVRLHTKDVRGYPCVSVSTHKTSVGVRQHTLDVRVCPLAHIGHPWLSVCVRQHTQDVLGCPSVHISARWSLDSARWPFPWPIWVILAQVGCLFSTHRTSVGVRQHTQDVCGCLWLFVSTHMTSVAVCECPSAHTGRLWLSISTHISTLVLGLSTLALPVDCSAHTRRPWLSVCVCVCPSAHTGCMWLSISTHISTLVLGLSTLTLPVDCSGVFGPRGLSVLYTQDVRWCPPAHTGRPWLSVCVRVCPSVSVSTHKTSVAVHHYTYQHAGPSCGLFGTHRTSVGVRQHTQDVCGCLWLFVSTHRTSVAVRVCPPAHTGRLWLSISTHISTLVLGLSTLTLPVDCSGVFGPPGLSVLYTQDVRGCPPAHTGRPWLSVCVRVCPSAHTGRLSLSISTHISTLYTQDVRGCPPAHAGRPWLSVTVRQHTQDVDGCPCVSVCVSQHTQDVRGCPSAHTGRPCVSVSTHRTSVCVRVCPSSHVGRPWLSISTHISTLYTHDVHGCPPEHVGRPWLSVAVRQHTQDVRGCTCVSVCVHQHTNDIRGCPSAHTGRLCVSVSTHRTSVAVRVCPSAHTGRLWLSISTHISTLDLGLSTLTLPVDCSGDFGPRGLSVEYTQDIRGYPPAHAGHPWLFVAVRQHSQDVHGCPCVSECVRQNTQDVRGCPSAHTGRLWVSVSTHRTSVAVRVSPCVSVSTHRTSVAVHHTHRTSVGVCQHTQDVRGFSWLSVRTHRTSVAVRVCLCVSVSTHRRYVAVHQYTYQHVGPWTQHADPSRGLFGCFWPTWAVCSVHTGHPWVSTSTHRTAVAVRVCLCVSVCVRQHTQDVCGYPSVHISARCTHRTSVGVRQHTHDICGCPSAHTGHLWLSMFVCVCPSAHTGRMWLSISTHISTLVLGLSTLTLPVDCLGVFGPRGLSVLYTQDVRGCPPASTGWPWLSVCVCACPSMSVTTHRTSVAVHPYTYQHIGPWTQHAGPSCGLFGTQKTSVAVRMCLCVSVSTNKTYVVVHQYTYQHVGPWTQHADPSRGLFGCFWPTWAVCSVHTGRPWVSTSTQWTTVAVRVCSWVSVCTHRTSVVVRLYTQDVRGCPPAHTGWPWLSVCVCACPSVSVSTHRTCVAVHHTHRTSVGVRQHMQDIRGCSWLSVSTHRTSMAVRVCLCVSVSTHMTSVAVRVCPSAHTGRLWLSISTHISTLVLGLSRLTLPVDCLGNFGPRGLSVQYIQDVCGCPPEHIGRPWVSVSTHRTSVGVRQHTQDVRGCPCESVCVRQHTQDVCGCPSVHISARWSLDSARWPFPWTITDVRGFSWLSVSTHRTSVAVRVCLCVSVSTHRRYVAVHQYTYQHVGPWTQHADPSRGLFGCFWPMWAVCSVHTGRPRVSTSKHMMAVAVRVRLCPSPHIGRLWLSIRTHISTLVLGLSTLALPVDCLGDFWPTWAVFSLHIGRPWVSVSTHMTSVCVRQHTKDVSCCPYVSVCVRQHTQDVCGCPSIHISARWTSVGVHQHTMDDRGCPCVFVGVRLYTQDVRGCPSVHTGRPWVSTSTHRTAVAVRVCLCVSVCVRQHTQDVCGCPSVHISARWSLDSARWPFPWTVWVIFGPRGLSVQYTQDVRGCPPAHAGHPWLFVAVRQHTQDVHGCSCVSVCVRQHTHDICGCPCVSVSTHTGRLWLSISTHISTLVLGLSRLTLPVDCLVHTGRLWVSVSTHRTSVGVRQHTQDVRVCPSAHTGRPLLSVCVRLCPSAHTGRPWLSISTHISMLVLGLSTLVLGLSTLAIPVDYLGDFWPAWAVCSVHTGHPWVSASTHMTSVEHTRRMWLSINTHISTLVLGLGTLTLPVDCLGVFGPHGLSVLYTQDVRGCPPAHNGQPWLSVCVRGCPSVHTGRSWVSVCTHRTSVGVHQHTQDGRGCPCVNLCVSVCVRQHTQDVCGCPSVHISARWSLDSARWPFPWTVWVIFGPRGLSVQYTQDVRGCPPAHAGHPWLLVAVRQHTQDVHGCSCVSVCVRQHTHDICGCPCVSVSTHRTSVAVHKYTYQHVGLWTQQADPSRGLFGTSVGVRQHTQDVRVCPSAHTGRPLLSVCVRLCPSAHTGRPWLSISTHISTLILGLSTTHRTSVGVRQHTHDVRGCPSAHTGRLWLSVFVCVCPSAHTGRMWLSISTHISTLVLGLSTLTLPIDCSGVFGPRGLSVLYTQDVRGCPLAHTGRPCLSVCVCVCPSVSVSTHRTSVAVHQYIYQHVGPWTQHADPSRGLFGCFWPTWAVCSVRTGRPWVSTSTHRTAVAVRVCLCVSVCVRQHTQDVCGCPSVHISARWSLDSARWPFPWTIWVIFGPRGLSVLYTQDVRGCPPAHNGQPWLSVCVRGCPSVHTGRPWVSVCTHRTSVGVHQHTQDGRGCPCVSVRVRLCPSAHTERVWLSISTHIGTLVLGLSTLALPVDCLGDFWPTWAVCSVHTGRPWMSASTRRTSVAVSWLSVSTHRTSMAVRVFLCVSVSTHMTSVAVRVCQSAHTGRLWLSISTHISTLVLGLSRLTLPVDCLGNYGPRGLSVQYIQDVCGCPSAHIGRPWVSVSTHRTSVCVRQHTQDVRCCLCVSVCVRQHTQDVRGCPSVHISARCTHRTSVGVRQHTHDVRGTHKTYVAVHQYTQDVRGCPWHTQDVCGCPSVHISARWSLDSARWPFPWTVWVIFGPRGLSVQYTQDVRGYPPAHAGHPSLFVAVRQHTQDVHGCPCVSECVRQHTQDVRGCPSAHTGRLWVSVSTHRTSVAVRVGPCVSVSTHMTSVAVHQYTYQHVGPWTQHAGHSRGLFGTSVAVRGCPSAHTGRLWLSVSVCVCLCVSVSTHRRYVAVHQYTYQHVGPWTQHADPSRGLLGCFWPTWAVCSVHTGRPWVSSSTHRTAVAVRVCLCVSVCVRQHTQDVCGCPSVHISARCTHRTSVGVRQHTHDVRGCPSAHTGHLWLSVFVCVCPSAHTGRRPRVSTSKHMTAVAVRVSVRVRLCPSPHIGRLWLSIRTHISTLVLGLSTLALPVDCLGDFWPTWAVFSLHIGRPWMSVSTHMTSVCVRQHTKDVSGCPYVSVCVRQQTQDVCGCPSIHISACWTSVGVHQHTLDGRGCPCVFVGVRLYTQDVRGCPSVHTGRPWVSTSTHRTAVAVCVCLCVSVCVRQHTQDVCGCPSVHISARWSLDSARWPFPWTVWVIFGPRGLSVQYTQDVRGCPPAHAGHPWLFVAVRQHTQDVHGCSCVFVCVRQHTQDVRGCPSAHTGRPWLSVSTHRTFVAVRADCYRLEIRVGKMDDGSLDGSTKEMIGWAI
ncbi:hypothetical protein YC2023_066295 [Brassica napus]